jgi:hypothetical protein
LNPDQVQTKGNTNKQQQDKGGVKKNCTGHEHSYKWIQNSKKDFQHDIRGLIFVTAVLNIKTQDNIANGLHIKNQLIKSRIKPYFYYLNHIKTENL